MLLVHERFHGLGMDAIMTICFGIRTLLMFGHGCSVDRMLLARNQNYAHALMTVCFWHTNAIKVLAGGGVEWASFLRQTPLGCGPLAPAEGFQRGRVGILRVLRFGLQMKSQTFVSRRVVRMVPRQRIDCGG